MNPRNSTFIATVLLVTSLACVSWSQEYNAFDPSTDRVVEYFEVHNADIRSVCRQLSTYSGTDIVVGENVKAMVSIAVSKKSWRDILGIVCRMNNLAAVNEGNYVYVVTEEEFRKQKLDNASALQMTQDLSPLKREMIKVENVPASEMKDAVQSLLSTRGKVTVVGHANSLLIFDTEDNINQIRKLISDLDIETSQISISCKIIEVSSGASRNMGIHWGYMDPASNIKAQHIPKDSGFIAGALNQVLYGILTPDRFQAALEYLFEDNKAEVVAQPQITTLDNKEAKIFMGQQIPIKSLDLSGNTVVKLINAGTQLTVTPHVSGEGRILLTLNPKKESYQLLEGDYIINEQSAQTNVVVNNGETVVIAGLTSNETFKAESGIPILKDIPLFGHLFKRSRKEKGKKDLVIFVTPNIINSAYSVPKSDPSSFSEQ